MRTSRYSHTSLAILLFAMATVAFGQAPPVIADMEEASESGSVHLAAGERGARVEKQQAGTSLIRWPDLEDPRILRKSFVGWSFESIPGGYFSSWDDAPDRGLYLDLHILFDEEFKPEDIVSFRVEHPGIQVERDVFYWLYDSEDEIENRVVLRSNGTVQKFYLNNIHVNAYDHVALALSPWRAEIELADGRTDSLRFFLPPPGESMIVVEPTLIYLEGLYEGNTRDHIPMLGAAFDCTGSNRDGAYEISFRVDDARAEWVNVWLYNSDRRSIGHIGISKLIQTDTREATIHLNDGQGLKIDGSVNRLSFDDDTISFTEGYGPSDIDGFRVIVYDGAQYPDRFAYDCRAYGSFTTMSR